MCRTLLTVPPLPEPSSLMNSMSSGRRSRLYSMPISRCADSSLPLAVSAVGGGLGAAGVKARALKFFRFIDRGAKSAMVGDVDSGERRRRGEVNMQRPAGDRAEIEFPRTGSRCCSQNKIEGKIDWRWGRVVLSVGGERSGGRSDREWESVEKMVGEGREERTGSAARKGEATAAEMQGAGAGENREQQDKKSTKDRDEGA